MAPIVEGILPAALCTPESFVPGPEPVGASLLAKAVCQP